MGTSSSTSSTSSTKDNTMKTKTTYRTTHVDALNNPVYYTGVGSDSSSNYFKTKNVYLPDEFVTLMMNTMPDKYAKRTPVSEHASRKDIEVLFGIDEDVNICPPFLDSNYTLNQFQALVVWSGASIKRGSV